MAVTVETCATDTAIRRFEIEVSETDLQDLRARIAATRRPERETVGDDSQGVPPALMRDLARYVTEIDEWTSTSSMCGPSTRTRCRS